MWLPEYITLEVVSFDRYATAKAIRTLISRDVFEKLRSLVAGFKGTVWWFHEAGQNWAERTASEWGDMVQSALDKGASFDFAVADEDDWWSTFVWAGYVSQHGDNHMGFSLKRDHLRDVATSESYFLKLGEEVVMAAKAAVGYVSLDGWPTWNGRVSSPLEAYYGLVGEPLVRSLRDHARGVYWANWWQRDLIASKMALVNKVVAELQPVEQRWLPGESHWYFQIADHADQVTGQRVRQWMTALQSVMPQGRPIYRVPRKEWIL